MKDLININRLNRFGQNIWNRIKDVFMTKEDAINGILVGQEWTKIGSVVANTSISLPPTDTFTELYIEMYSSNGTITHNINIRLDSILYESNNMEYREILLDSVYDAQTYVKYDFVNNSIVPVMYEGNEINSSSNVTTNIYTKTNKMEVGNIEAEKIVYDNSASGISASNVQGAIDEIATNAVISRCKKIKLLSPGWYRIAKIECDTIQEANGSNSNSCEIEIKRTYSTLSTEYKKIKLLSIYQTSSFAEEVSKNYNSDTNTITKIRHTVDTVNNTTYIEVYYKAETGNNMSITLNNHTNWAKEWELIDPTTTSETVNGVNVLGSHEFLLNTSSFSTYENLLYTPTVNLTTSTQVVRQVTVKRKGLLSTSFEIMANSIGIDYLSISVNDIEFARVCSPNNSASISMSMVVNAGDVVKYNAKGVGTGTNNGRIGGYIIYFN